MCRCNKISYDLPSLFSKRATSIGYGRRTTMLTTSRNQCKDDKLIIDGVPGPGSVELRGIFDKGTPKSKAFSFGVSREHYNKVYVEGSV